MQKGDAKYMSHFHDMVAEGVCCGLETPQEWLRSYSRCISKPYDQIPEIDEFIALAEEELFELIHMRPHESEQELVDWLDGK